MLAGVLVLILAAPATPLAPATKPPSSRDVGRLVNEAATIEDALATARLLPLAGEETQHWETQDVHIARRRKTLTALIRRVTRWTVGGAAAEARRGVLANDDFRRCMHLLAEAGPAEAYAAERRDGLRLVAALAQAPDALAPVAQDVDAAFRVALDELDGDDVEEETELQVNKVVEELAGDLFKGQTDAPETLPEQQAAEPAEADDDLDTMKARLQAL